MLYFSKYHPDADGTLKFGGPIYGHPYEKRTVVFTTQTL